jgi:hypothetical protein
VRFLIVGCGEVLDLDLDLDRDLDLDLPELDLDDEGLLLGVARAGSSGILGLNPGCLEKLNAPSLRLCLFITSGF